jgi:hypothetical protein
VVLSRTAVVLLDEARVLVALHRLDVDPEKLIWQKKGSTARDAFLRGAALRKARKNPGSKSA